MAEGPGNDSRVAQLSAAVGHADPERRAAGLRDLHLAWPDWDEPSVHLGEWHRGRGEIGAAIACYNAALRCNPHRIEALLALGAMHVAAGRAEQAEPHLRLCCAVAPNDGAAHHAWGLSLLLLGRADEACDALAQGVILDDDNALCAVHFADAAHASGRGEACIAALEQCCRHNPANAAALTGLAAALAHAGRRDEALDTFEAATLLDPSLVVPAAMFADMVARTTRPVDAERALRHAIALDPHNHDAAMALSVVLMRLHRYGESLRLLQDLLASGIDRAAPLCNMTTVLVALGRTADAVACAREAIALAPRHTAPRRALCNALPYQPGITGSDLLNAARDCADLHPRPATPGFSNGADPHRRLRLGLLSGTFRNHPVGWLTIAGFERLDPARHELVCLTPNKPEDEIGRRFAAIAAVWDDTGGLDDAALAARIRALGIDILIDLGGHGDFGRMTVCSQRPAPVQIKWVGMQNHSSGIAEMDWFMSDRWETPLGFERFYSERLLILPDGYVCYAPPDDAPEVAMLPALTRGAITFGCYNNLAKINADVIAVWSVILNRVQGARLILKTHQFNDADCRAHLHAGFAAHGVSADRVILRGSSPHRVLLDQYADIDVVLDPFPYSGGLTTCEALWMGVPTLTMPGETFASRHSASHMANIGLPQWAVPNLDAYIDAAVSLAADLPGLASLRAGLRDRTRRSPLCDAARFGASLDAALRRAWSDWCARTSRDRPDFHASLSPTRQSGSEGAGNARVAERRHQSVRA